MKMRNLYKMRILAGLSQLELSKKVGTARSVISEYETGRRGAHPARVKKLAEACGCSTSDLGIEV